MLKQVVELTSVRMASGHDQVKQERVVWELVKVYKSFSKGKTTEGRT